MTAARILAPLACLLLLMACGNVSPSHTDGGVSSSSASSASGSSVSGCSVSTIDAGSCSAYGSCVTASVTGTCKSNYDACYRSSGPCSAYVACTAPCDCRDSACVSACTSSMTSDCTSCLQTADMCSENACATPLAQCLVGMPDAGTHTCADLARCCASLPTSAQSSCVEAVSVGNDTLCSTLFAVSGCL